MSQFLERFMKDMNNIEKASSRECQDLRKHVKIDECVE